MVGYGSMCMGVTKTTIITVNSSHTNSIAIAYYEINLRHNEVCSSDTMHGTTLHDQLSKYLKLTNKLGVKDTHQ